MFRTLRTRRAASFALAALLLVACVLAVMPHAQAASTILGTTTVQPTTDTDSIGQAEAFSATATGSGSVTTLSVYVDTTSSATTLVAGIYADSGGNPGALLAQGSLAAPTGGAWNTVNLSAAVNVTSGSTYWLTILGASGSGNLAFRDRCCGSGTVSETSTQNNLSALPASWSRGATWHDGPASIYAGPLVTPTPTPTTGPGTPTATATLPPTATPTPTPTATPPPGTVIFSDNFSGTTLNPVWTVVTRHGEYAQLETECNTPSAVSVNNGLTITTTAQSATCGDYNLDGSVRHTPAAWPYTTGDIQWNDFSFTYGTVTFRTKMPPQNTGTWPTLWLLGSNCQATNIMTADTGYDACPAIHTPGYVEADMIECDTQNWCQLALAQPSSFPACGYPVDSNWHTYTFVWTASAISISVDGAPPVCSFTAAQGYVIPSTPMFLIIQTQTGGSGGTPNNANLPATFEVSSVTVTQP